jgi:hypothetical protein
MPRIQSLAQEKRLDVGSPVPIRSAASAGVEGEAIAQVGQTLASAGAAFGKIIQATREEKQKVSLRGLDEMAQQAAMQAYAASQNDPEKKSDGSNQFEIYHKKFVDMMKPTYDKLDDEMKGYADEIMMKNLNSQTASVLQSALNAQAEFISDEDRNRHNILLANTYTNPEAVLENIQKNTEAVSDIKLGYSEEKRRQLIKSDTQAIARNALNSYVDKKEFSKAKDLLNNKLAAYFGPDEKGRDSRLEAMEYINNKQDAHRRQVLQDQRQSEQLAEESFRNQREELVAELSILAGEAGMVPNGYDKAQQILAVSEGFRLQGILKPTDINEVLKRSKAEKSLMTSNNAVVVRSLVQDINDGKLEDIQTKIASAASVEGNGIAPETAAYLHRMASIQKSILAKGGRPLARIVEEAGRSVESVSDVLPPEASTRIQLKIREAAQQGKDAFNEAGRLVREEANRAIVTRKKFSFQHPLIDMLYEQKNMAGFNSIDNMFKQGLSELEKDPRNAKKVVDLLKYYKERKKLLGIIERESDK